ncbi:chemotaxis protein CheW [Aromatoleum diolicum]|uniref:Chemotaxis protein CheW n=1 Tax=Aromatoleum diolicum TaxID=75796 RepID=A0ABX1QF52_9RHOO|nr:chemotaxis protein CheW [Aromatoleum diolicum]NMG76938.1 chemotaxis protein CheW [Aromatoleum diolicum]
MLFLLFQLGNDRYALDTGQVTEVLPLVRLKQIPQAPPAVAGVFDFRGEPVPVVDLSQMALGRPAHCRLSTRIILAHYPDTNGEQRLLGLIAERVTETIRRDPSDFVTTGVDLDAASYLGPVASDARGLIQRVEVDQLLTSAVRDLLFKQPVAS